MKKENCLIKDCLGQDVSVGDILMLAFSYTRRNLEPALLTGIAPLCRIGGADFIELSLLIEDLDTKKITDHKLSVVAINDDLEAWIEPGIKINNPEFFIHDERISRLLSERPRFISR